VFQTPAASYRGGGMMGRATPAAVRPSVGEEADATNNPLTAAAMDFRSAAPAPGGVARWL